MTQRPTDVPAAVRAAFTRSRVAAAWEMVSRSTGPDRVAALGGFERMLAADGLELADVATAILAPAAATPAASAAPMGDAFGSFFSDFANMARPTPRPAERPRMRNVHVTGQDIPEQIHGRVRIEDERTVRTGTMLVFTVISTDGDVTTNWGPVASFSDASIAKLRKAADRDDPMRISMKLKPAAGGRMPSTTAVWFA